MKRLTSYFIAAICVVTLVTFAGPRAYASSASPTAGTVKTSAAQLNVRSGPASSYGVVATLPKGGVVTLYEKNDGWWRVGLPHGQFGYCSGAYISVISGSAAQQISASSLNVRSGPSASYAVKTVLSGGTVVVRLSTSGNFAKIVYDGTNVGYVNASYLKSVDGSSSTASYAAVSLNVPSYKQTDSRWAAVEVGDSGRTIGDIGCATTALAMTESYRTSSTVTPDKMEERLTYDSGGSLYWPDNYALVSSITFSQLYAKLKSGIPVVVGCKNASGGSHFVVITGYSGGSGLTASGFTINDPGSSSRTTLAQFLSAYPTLFRRLYYTN